MSLQSEYDKAMATLGARFDEINWDDKGIYGAWMAQVYHIVKHSTRLLALASAHCPFEHNSLHQRFIRHAGEEMGHDVLAKRDLAALGFAIDACGEMPETNALVQFQYTSIQKKSALAFFGYILLLEGLAITVGPRLAERVGARHGKKSTTFLKVHIEEDENHVEEAFKSLSSFADEEINIVRDNLRDSTRLYLTMLGGLSREGAKTPYLGTEGVTDAGSLSQPALN